MYLFQLYHQISKKKNDGSIIFKPVSSWPAAWTTVTLKCYERFPLLPLPSPARDLEPLLSTTLRTRRSRRNFGNSLDVQLVSNLLAYSGGELDGDYEHGIKRRVYQSGGARYPLEIYLIFFKDVGDIAVGVYHYDVPKHGLRKLRGDIPSQKDMIDSMKYPFVANASFAVFFTACFSRTAQKYGEIAYRFSLIEAGCLSQNFSLVSDALGIDAVSLGMLANEMIEPLLDIDGTEESLIHSMYFG